jgi:hypothetical protein
MLGGHSNNFCGPENDLPLKSDEIPIPAQPSLLDKAPLGNYDDSTVKTVLSEFHWGSALSSDQNYSIHQIRKPTTLRPTTNRAVWAASYYPGRQTSNWLHFVRPTRNRARQLCVIGLWLREVLRRPDNMICTMMLDTVVRNTHRVIQHPTTVIKPEQKKTRPQLQRQSHQSKPRQLRW